ncbi:MAG: hypothetical protein RIT45_3977 [Pseudomonadota bacterium]|jgi:hypothetical protein
MTSSRSASLRLGWFALALPWLAGCVADPNETVGWAALDRAGFACEVEPVLETHCSMPACHGAASRRMPVLAPGRMRLAGELAAAIAAQPASEREAGTHPRLTEVEIDANFAAARAMVLPEAGEASPLLDKPLSVAAGGGYHAPDGDVFAAREDAGYAALLRWVRGEAVCP